MRKYFLFIFLTVQMFFCSCNGQDKKVIWKEAIGTLDPRGHSPATIYYQVDGKTYSATFYLESDDAALGEKYTMRYNIDNPLETEIDYWHPIFVPGEETYLFIATIKKVHKKSVWDPTPFVVYTFDIKGINYKRSVYLPPNYKELYPDLREGKRYQVECFAKDAVNRVVLHLDKPITAP